MPKKRLQSVAIIRKQRHANALLSQRKNAAMIVKTPRITEVAGARWPQCQSEDHCLT